MCQLDWAMGCPDIWSNIILSVSVRVFLDEINIWIGRVSKADLSSLMWVGLTQSVEGLDRPKGLTLPQMRKLFLFWGCISILSFLQTQTEPSVSSWVSNLLVFRPEHTLSTLLVLKPSGSHCNLHHLPSWVSRLLTADLGTSQSPWKYMSQHISQF